MADLTVLMLARPGDPGLPALSRLPAGVRVLVAHGVEDALPLAPEADALLVATGNAAALERIWRAAPRVRWIHTRPAGVDHLLFSDLVQSPVLMTNSRGVFSSALAEFAMLGLLFFLKDTRHLLRNQQLAKWAPYEPIALRARTVGIVGLGDIGRAVAVALRGSGARIIGLRRSGRPDPVADEVLSSDRLLEMAARVDDLVVATPLTEETHHLIGDRVIGAMRPGAVLVNIGRGKVVDETALLAALDQGRLRGTALDVFEQEPLAPDHPFWRMDNVLISPHTADHTAGWEADTMAPFLENARRFRDGEPLLNPVDKRLGY
jgi:phosphoglycerate dehydrogenase-like enzyme